MNERVKYREAIRPLAPMATLEAAQQYFELLPGASDADYNAYNYMVLTAHSKPGAREKIPAVIHADGTGRIQIVRAEDDPLTYAYLKALGRRIGVEMSVNTSFNVAGPIAQTPQQAIDTLRRSKGLDVVVLVAERRHSPRGLARRRARQRTVYWLVRGMEMPAAGRLTAETTSTRARRSTTARCRSQARLRSRAAKSARPARESRAGSRSPESAASPA